MDNTERSQIEWRVPWHRISPDYAKKAEAELRSEVSAGHVLYKKQAKAIGYRQDCDDVLFEINEDGSRFAVVHLTYQRESDPNWPATVIYDSIGAWIDQCMVPDAQDFNA